MLFFNSPDTPIEILVIVNFIISIVICLPYTIIGWRHNSNFKWLYTLLLVTFACLTIYFILMYEGLI